MCGILAVIGRGHRERFDEALDTLRHRGPDDRGVWTSGEATLGSRRLAIFDLSTAGHQPMVDAATGVGIAFNGAIYNHLELRSELESLGHRFHSTSDTEVLLCAYLEWGDACVVRLNGMWALVVWDPRTGRAFVSRDRFGVKPLVYAVSSGCLVVASEPKAILALDPGLRRPDESALLDFLANGALYAGSRTFYEGIRQLRPAHSGTFAPGGADLQVHRYWNVPDGQGKAPSMEAFSAALDEAVRIRLRSDAPLGFTLSGGLDSTAILAAAATAPEVASGGLTAYTSAFGDADERAWAAEAASHYLSVRLVEVATDLTGWLDVQRAVAWHLDGPGYSPAVIAVWRIMEAARRDGVKVLLEGQGGDELLGGYAQHAALAAATAIRTAVRQAPSPGMRRALADAARLGDAFGRGTLGLWLLRERLPASRSLYRGHLGLVSVLRPELLRQGAALDAVPRSGPSLRDRLVDDLTRAILPGLLHYGDAISMAHSVEARQPFLDYRLVELCLAARDGWQAASGETKHLLREHLRAAGQQRVADRRDKRGFPTPLRAWLQQKGEGSAQALLSAPDARIGAYVRPEPLRTLLRRGERGPFRAAAENHLYRLVSTELWLRACIG